MQPTYHLKRAIQSTTLAWRGRFRLLASPLLFAAAISGLITLASHLLPKHLRLLVIFPEVLILYPFLHTLASVTTATASIPFISRAGSEPAKLFEPGSCWQSVLRLTHFSNLVIGYVVRAVALALAASLVVGSIFVFMLAVQSAGKHHTAGKWVTGPVSFFFVMSFLLVWYLALSPYRLAMPMFAIARGTPLSMFKASMRFTAGSRGMMAALAATEVFAFACLSGVQHLLMASYARQSAPVLVANIAVGLAFAIVSSWFVTLYTALAWQVSGLDRPAGPALR